MNLVHEFKTNLFAKERRKQIFSIFLYFGESMAFFLESGITNADNVYF